MFYEKEGFGSSFFCNGREICIALYERLYSKIHFKEC